MPSGSGGWPFDTLIAKRRVARKLAQFEAQRK
jgi:hypothetical protein